MASKCEPTMIWPNTTVTVNILIFYYYFSEEKKVKHFDINHVNHLLGMKCQALFSLKNTRKCHLLQL